jgi:hypothetical protein
LFGQIKLDIEASYSIVPFFQAATSYQTDGEKKNGSCMKGDLLAIINDNFEFGYNFFKGSLSYQYTEPITFNGNDVTSFNDFNASTLLIGYRFNYGNFYWPFRLGISEFSVLANEEQYKDIVFYLDMALGYRISNNTLKFGIYGGISGLVLNNVEDFSTMNIYIGLSCGMSVGNLFSSSEKDVQEKASTNIRTNNLIQKNIDNQKPEIIILKPTINETGLARTTDRVYRIEGKVTDNKAVETISVNSKEVYFDNNGNFSSTLELVKGRNDIRIIAKDINGNETHQEIILIRNDYVLSNEFELEVNAPITSIKNNETISLVIAIKKYSNQNVPQVMYADNDARAIRIYLEKSFGYDTKNILPQNEEELMTLGTMKNYIKNVIPSYLKQDGSSDLFIYFTGHGAPSTKTRNAYFVPYDCDPNYVSDINAYNMNEFYSDIAKLNAKKKIVVIDACFSGQSGDGNMLIKDASPIYVTMENEMSLDDKSIMFLSSGADQVSNWYPEKKHSMFTYFFLKGLQGNADINKDGSISVAELENYINDENNGLPYFSNREFQRPQKAVIYGKDLELLLK